MNRAAAAWTLLFLAFGCAGGGACGRSETTIGEPDNPLVIALFPSSRAGEGRALGRALAAHLSSDAAIAARVRIPRGYIDALRGLRDREVDYAFVSSFGYLLASDEFGAEARLQVVRGDRLRRHHGEIIARSDSGIFRVADLAGKTFAFSDPYSTSGFLMAARHLRDVKLGRRIFAGSHEAVVQKVYDGEVDAGATYWNPPAPDGTIRDGRRAMLGREPRAGDVLRVVALTDEVPNEPVICRPGVSRALRSRVERSLVIFAESGAGRDSLDRFAEVTDLVVVRGIEYRELRRAVVQMVGTAEKMVPDGWRLHLRTGAQWVE